MQLTCVDDLLDHSMPVPESGCWLWLRAVTRHGYAWMRWKGKTALGHRVAYTLAHGEVPPGLEVMHQCDVPGCVNPAHLRAGTHAENMRDMKLRGRSSNHSNPGPRKTHCKHGHPLSGDNLRLEVNGKYVTRRCVECAKRWGREYWQRKKERDT